MHWRQRQIYEAMLLNPPKSRRHGFGAAYWLGYDNPRMSVSKAGPVVGLPGSEARACYRAGQVARRRSDG